MKCLLVFLMRIYARLLHLYPGRFKEAFLDLFSGFVFGYIISYVCYATWDWSAYHGFPEAPPKAWYVALRHMIEIVLVWSVFLLWPAIISLVQLGIKKRKIV